MNTNEDTGEINFTFLRTEHNYDRDKVSRETALVTPTEEGRTQQQFKEETDINTIVERFGLTGHLPENPRMPLSGDFTETVNDYKSAMNMVRQAEEAFMEFPAQLRAEFNNDPQKMMDFLGNEKNREKALELGLLAKPPEKTRNMVDAVDELKAHFVSQSGTTKDGDKK